MRPKLFNLLTYFLLSAGLLIAGTVGEIEEYDPPPCVFIPKDMLCLSACAFGSLKAKELIVEGKLGFHLPYNPDTMESDMNSRLWTLLFLHEYSEGRLSYFDVVNTTPSIFWIEGDLVDWHTLRNSYNVVSSVSDLQECPKEK